jgi:arylsulfatase A-like enzyme
VWRDLPVGVRDRQNPDARNKMESPDTPDRTPDTRDRIPTHTHTKEPLTVTRCPLARRFGFSLLLVCWCVAPWGPSPAWAQPRQAEQARPNIIFIMADDLGYGDLGCYGQQQIQTPRIDRLAAQGLRFLDCYAGSTVCAPSRCCLMTGVHTGHARVRGNALVPLEEADVTVAEMLHDAGYATGIVGKWGLGEPETSGIPTRQGFDYWFGYLNQRNAHNYYPEYLWRNTKKYPLSGNLNNQRQQYTHDLFEEQALAFLRAKHEGPFFLYLPLTIPHANNELGGKTGNGMEVPSDAPYSNRDWPEQQKNHAAMITRMDASVGRIMDLLKELKIDENTIVFFTSDNGPHKEGGADPKFFDSSGPLRGYKRDLYEGGIRVPMIVRWPGHVPADSESRQAWAFWDVLPTLCELAGAETPSNLDGVSVVPALLGDTTVANQRPMYWEFHERGSSQAVRQGQWKAVRVGGPQAAVELYDLESDLGEQQNVAESHPEVVAKLTGILEASRTESPRWPLKSRRKK